jgi:hypothetical protein
MANKKDKIVLVIQDSNWADEFDTFGMALYPSKVWEQHLKDVKARFQVDASEREIYFGTNEAQRYEIFDTYKESFKVKNISTSELNTLKKIFKLKVNKTVTYDSHSVGIYPVIDTAEEIHHEIYTRERKEKIANYTIPQIYKLQEYEVREVLEQRPEIQGAYLDYCETKGKKR